MHHISISEPLGPAGPGEKKGRIVSSVIYAPHDGLTQREREVLGLIAHGHTSKQVAERLAVSIHTVSNHRKHICRKLSLHSTAELVAFAARSMANGRVDTAGNALS